MKRPLECSIKIKKDAPIKDIIGCTTILLIKPCFLIISLVAVPKLPRMYWLGLKDIFKLMDMPYMTKLENKTKWFIYIVGHTHAESMIKKKITTRKGTKKH